MRGRRSATFIDCFTAGLDDLSRKQQADDSAVLAVLRETKRFSVFEATENQTIARTMTRLTKNGRITTDLTLGYPWTRVTHIDAEPLSEGHKAATPTPPVPGQE